MAAFFSAGFFLTTFVLLTFFLLTAGFFRETFFRPAAFLANFLADFLADFFLATTFFLDDFFADDFFLLTFGFFLAVFFRLTDLAGAAFFLLARALFRVLLTVFLAVILLFLPDRKARNYTPVVQTWKGICDGFGLNWALDAGPVGDSRRIRFRCLSSSPSAYPISEVYGLSRPNFGA